MKFKKIEPKTIIITIAILVILITLFRNHIKYFIKNGQDIIISLPDSFVFYTENENSHFDHIFAYEGSNDEKCWYDSDKYMYHIFVDRKVFEDNNCYAYVTGKYYNYPFQPSVKFDKKQLSVTTENSGGTSKNFYFNKLYHFEIPTPLVANKEYMIRVACKDKVERMYVVFHESESSIPNSLNNRKVYYTLYGTTYHKNKNCSHIRDAEQVFCSTLEYCGMERACKECN